MANKYLSWSRTNSQTEEVEATATSAGAGDAGEIPALDATGRLDISMMPVGIAPDTKNMPATETMSAGCFVNVYLNGGTEKARKADATNGRRAHGFILTAMSTLGGTVMVYFEGTNNQATGITRGNMYYLSTTAGGYTSTPTTTATYYVQELGVGCDGTEISFEPGQPIKLA